MSQTLSPSLARWYGMARVARVWKFSRASVYRSRKDMPPNTSGRRPGPGGVCSDAELAEHPQDRAKPKPGPRSNISDPTAALGGRNGDAPRPP